MVKPRICNMSSRSRRKAKRDRIFQCLDTKQLVEYVMVFSVNIEKQMLAEMQGKALEHLHPSTRKLWSLLDGFHRSDKIDTDPITLPAKVHRPLLPSLAPYGCWARRRA